MNTRLSLAPLWAASALYFALTLALVLVVPFGQAPDEAAHAQYIEAIASHHALPVFAGQSPPAPGYEFHQPPLFYLLAAPFWALGGTGAQMVLARALSLVFGLATVWLVWRAARLVFGADSRAPAVCVLGAALSPLHQGVGASVNNDALAGLWAASLFYLVALAWLDAPSKRVVLTTGVVAGLGVLTKLTALPLGVWAFVCVGLALKKHARPFAALWPALGLALLLVAPMMIRNQILYGDPLAYRLFSHAATDVSPGIALFSQVIGADGYARGMALQIIGTAFGFWGGSSSFAHVVGTFSPSGPRFPSPLWALPLLLAVGVPLGGALSAWRARTPTEDDGANGRSLSGCWAAGAMLVGLLWLNFALAHVAGGQARYLHPALLPVTLLVGGGLSRSRAGTFAAMLVGGMMVGLTLANIFVWKTLV